ncbi:MAG: HlyD family efflux transporter periplasmic adaptor subunit [Bacteroidota bacterium]|nr:HlyD family efflux transporter periplasmic adaptor subunit [Bacteroidota bacterium]
MTKKMRPLFFIAVYLLSGSLVLFTGCKQRTDPSEEAAVEAKTPVTVTNIATEPMADVIELNAHSTFLKKNSVKATVSGRIASIELNPGDVVKKGQLLLTLRTKESAAMEGYTPADSSMRFKGLIRVKAPRAGVISSVLHQNGDNVMEGDELVQIAEQGSLVFLLEVPYELNQVVGKTHSCKIILSDNREFDGTISSRLPVMDAQSQTVSYIVRVKGTVALPENLIAKVRLIRTAKNNATVLPKDAILSNETQSEFWVMKMINDTMAVKVNIKKGLENSEKVEIASPSFLKSDRFLLSGNYGLPDTAKVKIQKLK